MLVVHSLLTVVSLLIQFRSSKSKKVKQEPDGDLTKDIKQEEVVPKRVPLSLEEILAKKKAEEEAQSKVFV